MPSFIPHRQEVFPGNAFTFALYYVKDMDRQLVYLTLSVMIGRYVRVLVHDSHIIDGLLQDASRSSIVVTDQYSKDHVFSLAVVQTIGVLHPFLTPASCGGLMGDIV